MGVKLFEISDAERHLIEFLREEEIDPFEVLFNLFYLNKKWMTDKTHMRRFFDHIGMAWDGFRQILSMVLGTNEEERRETTIKSFRIGSKDLVLDVGTGTGFVAIGIAKSIPGVSVMGVDLSRGMLIEAKRKIREEKVQGSITLVLGDAEVLPFRSNVFSVVTSNYMLEYVSNPRKVISEMARVTRTQGKTTILTTGSIVEDTRAHLFPFSQKDLKEMLEYANLKNITVSRVNPYVLLAVGTIGFCHE